MCSISCFSSYLPVSHHFLLVVCKEFKGIYRIHKIYLCTCASANVPSDGGQCQWMCVWHWLALDSLLAGFSILDLPLHSLWLFSLFATHYVFFQVGRCQSEIKNKTKQCCKQKVMIQQLQNVGSTTVATLAVNALHFLVIRKNCRVANEKNNKNKNKQM